MSAGAWYVIGDSLTAPNGVGGDADPISWVYLLENRGVLTPTVNAQNARGIFNNGYAGAANQIGATWDLVGAPAGGNCLIHLGTNDVNNSGINNVQLALESLIEDLVALSFEVFVAFQPYPRYWDAGFPRGILDNREVFGWIQDTVRTQDAEMFSYVDNFFTLDGLHMTQRGHSLHANGIYKLMLDVVAQQT